MQVVSNGLKFNVAVEGIDGDPAVVLLHGFPDTHAVWRHQVPALVDAGYQVIAPDMRGRGGSERPSAVEEYFMPNMIGDVRGIIDALGVDRAHLVGHDWGAVVAWLFASFEPTRTRSLTAMSVGHPATFAWPTLRQRERSWYMLFFQFEGIAERALQQDDWRLFREWTRNHPETDAWIAELSKPDALTAGLNWYRANVAAESWFHKPLDYPKISAPVLRLHGADDHLLTPEGLVASEPYIESDLSYQAVHGGHWFQLDRPDNVNAILLGALESVHKLERIQAGEDPDYSS
jgi:pimeloyl-ACP methyl ester carboxylesterase